MTSKKNAVCAHDIRADPPPTGDFLRIIDAVRTRLERRWVKHTKAKFTRRKRGEDRLRQRSIYNAPYIGWFWTPLQAVSPPLSKAEKWGGAATIWPAVKKASQTRRCVLQGRAVCSSCRSRTSLDLDRCV